MSAQQALTTPQSRAALLYLAQATLGWPIHDTARFRRNCAQFGLGSALNLEHDYLD